MVYKLRNHRAWCLLTCHRLQETPGLVPLSVPLQSLHGVHVEQSTAVTVVAVTVAVAVAVSLSVGVTLAATVTVTIAIAVAFAVAVAVSP